MIRINEMFWTFQGEGANWGRRALFVRMPFCNLSCSWCDTQFNTFEKFEEDQIREFARKEPSRFAVLTGGEPMLNKDSPAVVRILKSEGFEIACETNGSAPIISGINFVTVSPKEQRDYEVDHDAFYKADEFKLIVDKNFDFEICKKFEGGGNFNCRLTLSPEFTDLQDNVKRIETFIMENPKWRMSLQTHKWIGMR